MRIPDWWEWQRTSEWITDALVKLSITFALVSAGIFLLHLVAK